MAQHQAVFSLNPRTVRSESMPNIFLTLTDGEPSDSDAVRKRIKSLKALGISMIALGLGPNTVRATTIANNLKHLGYDKTMAVSRLKDIPNKVINIFIILSKKNKFNRKLSDILYDLLKIKK